MASVFSLSLMGFGGGWGMNSTAGGGTTRSSGSVGASCAIVATGVMGDTGGRGGESGA